MTSVRASGVLVAIVTSMWGGHALACGGLFCDSSTVVVPPAQSAERLVFVMNPVGHTDPPEGLVEPGTTGEEGSTQPYGGASVDTYIEIAYSGAAADFAWIVPLLERPVLIGTAAPEIFPDLDQATAPRFTFTFSTGSTTVSGSSGGCGGSAMSASGDDDDDDGGDGFEAEPEVNVIAEEHVGPYEVVVLDAETAEDLRSWLVQHHYEIPAEAEPVLQRYVDEGKKFAAFRLSDDAGTGAIEPVVLRVPGNEPCIPLRLTPIASEPIVTVTAIVIGGGVTRPVNFSDTVLDASAVRPTSPFTSDYPQRLRDAGAALGGRTFETEYAAAAPSVFEAASPISQQILRRAGVVTRLSTRIAPGEMTDDPIFEVTDEVQEVSREHVIDVTDDPAALAALGVAPAPAPDEGDDGGGRSSETCAAASTGGRPLHALWIVGVAAVVLTVRRWRRG